MLSCVQLELEINNLCNDIYIHVFMMIVIIICILYRESICCLRFCQIMICINSVIQSTDHIHLLPALSTYSLDTQSLNKNFFTRDFGFDHSLILCISIHPCCIFGMGVLIQIKLILTDFIVFGIWCLNQRKKICLYGYRYSWSL